MTIANHYRNKVIADWIDYNGHMSEAYYVLLFGFATDALYDRLGFDSKYRERLKRSLYTVESHIRYLQEVSEGEEVTIETRLLSYDSKRLHFCHDMVVQGNVVATSEIMALHVSTQASGGIVKFGEADLLQFAALKTKDIPEYVGRAVQYLNHRKATMNKCA